MRLPWVAKSSILISSETNMPEAQESALDIPAGRGNFVLRVGG
jgi:hypothetical protein